MSKYQSFVDSAEKIHGDKYDYSLVEYTNAHTNVSILCRTHGKFFQSPTSHIHGKSGCTKCGRISVSNKLRNTTNTFICKSKQVHRNKYDYSAVKYTNTHTKVLIHCNRHGMFSQTPHSHTRGHGCPDCGTNRTANAKRSTKEQFVESANLVHNFKYDYTDVSYVNTNEKVDIRCPKHGLFSQRGYSHLQGIGCPQCTTGRYDYNSLSTDTELGSSDGILYLMKLINDTETFYKVGITTNLEQRQRQLSRYYNIELVAIVELTLLNCFIVEQNILASNQTYDPTIVFGGHTECLTLTDNTVADLVDVFHSIDNTFTFKLFN